CPGGAVFFAGPFECEAVLAVRVVDGFDCDDTVPVGCGGDASHSGRRDNGLAVFRTEARSSTRNWPDAVFYTTSFSKRGQSWDTLNSGCPFSSWRLSPGSPVPCRFC